MCFCDLDKDHLHLGLSVGGLVNRSKDILKKLTIIDDKGSSRGGGHKVMVPPIGQDFKANRATYWRSSRAFSIRGPPQ